MPGTIQENGLKLLRGLYDVARNSPEGADVDDIAKSNSIYLPDAETAMHYLADKGLIRVLMSPYTIGITAKGIDAIEEAMKQPSAATPNFPSTTFNSVTIQNMTGSTIQQSGSHSSLANVSAFTSDQTENLSALVELLSDHLAELAASAEQQRTIGAQVATLQAQLLSQPDPTIVQRACRIISEIGMHTIAAMIATGAEPMVWRTIQSLLERFSG